MNEIALRALIEGGAIKRIRLIANGAVIHAEVDTLTGTLTASTQKGAVRTWKSIDAAARWSHRLGLGSIQLELMRWQPKQKGLDLSS